MTSVSDTSDYKNVCKLAYEDDSFFNTFKSNREYNSILEHVSTDQGKLYLDYLNANFPEFIGSIDSFKMNDIHGGTKLSEYEGIGKISPTTLRYIKVLSDLKSLFGNLDNKKIVEIGVGYGGQCFITSQFFNISEYSLVDLDEVLSLSGKYLSKLNTDRRIINIDRIKDLDEDFDIVISNYSYSELNKEVQDLYWDKIIRRAKNGYFTLNFISHIFNIDSYNEGELISKFSEKNPKILQEDPKTFEKNIILYF
jgi:putative sugar O-methyltransferase